MATRSKSRDAVTALIVLGLVIGGLFWLFSGNSKANLSTTFSSSVTLAQPANPTTAVAVIQVENTGNSSSSPTCQVELTDASGTYHGSDTFTSSKVLKPGEKWGFRGQVTVTKEGAAYITKGSVSCYS